MKSINQKLAEHKKIRIATYKASLANWYIIAYNDEILNLDWRMFLSGVIQTIYNKGRLDAQSRITDFTININQISPEAKQKIEEYAAIYEIEF